MGTSASFFLLYVQQTSAFRKGHSLLQLRQHVALNGGPSSSVDIATDCGMDGPGSNPGGDEIFRPSRRALGPTQLPVK